MQFNSFRSSATATEDIASSVEWSWLPEKLSCTSLVKNLSVGSATLLGYINKFKDSPVPAVTMNSLASAIFDGRLTPRDY